MTNTVRSPFYAPKFSEQSIWTWQPPTIPLSLVIVNYYVPGTPWEFFYQQDERWQFAPHRNPSPYLAPIHLVANSQVISSGYWRSTVSFIAHLTALFGAGATQVKAPSFMGANTNILTRPALWIPRPAELQFWQPRPLPQPLTLLPATVTVSLSGLSTTISRTNVPLFAFIPFSAQVTATSESQASVLYPLHLSGKSGAVSESNLQPTVKTGLAAAGSISLQGRAAPSLIAHILALLGVGVSQVKAPSSLTVKYALTAVSKAMASMRAVESQGLIGITARLATQATAHAAATGTTLISATSKAQGVASDAAKYVANIASTLAANIKASGQSNQRLVLSAAAKTISAARNSLSGAAHLTARAVANTSGSLAISTVTLIFLSARTHIQSALRLAATTGKTSLSGQSSIKSSLMRGSQRLVASISASSNIRSSASLVPFFKTIKLAAASAIRTAGSGVYTFAGSSIPLAAKATLQACGRFGKKFRDLLSEDINISGSPE